MKNLKNFQEFVNEALNPKAFFGDDVYISKKLYFDKKIQDEFKAMVKDGFMDNNYHDLILHWYNTRKNENKGYLSIDKVPQKEKNNYEFATYVAKRISYSEFLAESSYIAWVLSKQIKDIKANREEIPDAYSITKEYFKNFGMDYSSSIVFDQAVKKLQEWMKKRT